MNEIRKAGKSKLIAFRVTDDQYAQIERSALVHGDEPNNWCRNVVVTESRQGFGLTKRERLLYEEIARVRYLVGCGFRILLSSKEATATMWKKITADADYKTEIVANDPLSRKK
jgi:hypothetical protein